MRRSVLLAATAAAITCLAGFARAADDRELVKMPGQMQEHLLESMRDHLVALNEILSALAAENYDKASKVAEERLGMSSFNLHGAAHMASFMPKRMQDAGNSLHRAASRVAVAAEDAGVNRSYESTKNLLMAMSEMTSACNACHAGYRIR